MSLNCYDEIKYNPSNAPFHREDNQDDIPFMGLKVRVVFYHYKCVTNVTLTMALKENLARAAILMPTVNTPQQHIISPML